MATTLTHTSARGTGMTGEEKFVIFASSLGTVFKWYDFYLYAVLAPFFAALFFPTGNALCVCTPDPVTISTVLVSRRKIRPMMNVITATPIGYHSPK